MLQHEKIPMETRFQTWIEYAPASRSHMQTKTRPLYFHQTLLPIDFCSLLHCAPLFLASDVRVYSHPRVVVGVRVCTRAGAGWSWFILFTYRYSDPLPFRRRAQLNITPCARINGQIVRTNGGGGGGGEPEPVKYFSRASWLDGNCMLPLYNVT